MSFTVSPVTTSGRAKSGPSVPRGNISDSAAMTDLNAWRAGGGARGAIVDVPRSLTGQGPTRLGSAPRSRWGLRVTGGFSHSPSWPTVLRWPALPRMLEEDPEAGGLVGGTGSVAPRRQRSGSTGRSRPASVGRTWETFHRICEPVRLAWRSPTG